jgi:hypothetical protein
MDYRILVLQLIIALGFIQGCGRLEKLDPRESAEAKYVTYEGFGFCGEPKTISVCESGNCPQAGCGAPNYEEDLTTPFASYAEASAAKTAWHNACSENGGESHVAMCGNAICTKKTIAPIQNSEGRPAACEGT